MNVKFNVQQSDPLNIVLCLPGQSFSGKFLDCYTQLIDYFSQKNIRFVVSRQYSPVVYYARNLCLGGNNLNGRNQKPFNGRISYSHLMWIDSDIIFRPKQFETLLRWNKDIVSGLYLMQNGKQFATVKHTDKEYFKKHGHYPFLTPKDIEGHKGLIEVDYTGFGFILIKRRVFESLEYPWFRPIFHEIGPCYDFASEDASVCQLIKEKNFKIHIDPNIRVGHEKEKIL